MAFPTSSYYTTGELLKGERQLEVLNVDPLTVATCPADGHIGTDCHSVWNVIVGGGQGRITGEQHPVNVGAEAQR